MSGQHEVAGLIDDDDVSWVCDLKQRSVRRKSEREHFAANLRWPGVASIGFADPLFAYGEFTLGHEGVIDIGSGFPFEDPLRCYLQELPGLAAIKAKRLAGDPAEKGKIGSSNRVIKRRARFRVGAVDENPRCLNTAVNRFLRQEFLNAFRHCGMKQGLVQLAAGRQHGAPVNPGGKRSCGSQSQRDGPMGLNLTTVSIRT